ncbi:far upstream element-binding protein 1-like [Sinocyclocheilus grahami]|uniref:far upstream element-binding protein 1-like n=1 Tax=Sinocyclocheilus grahami TaxID=75366 RepID=UPI0007AD35EB|nr:PREDICTED: far upstream element-binding protein 1-like [Sinocyclocheilus grahami]
MADYSNVAPPSSNAGGGMNDAFKDALQRARQIAAKIGGDGVPPSPVSNEFGYGGQKRPLEDGDQPETKKVPPSDPFSSVMGGMGGPPRSISEEFKVPDGMVGFIIGRGGEQISRIQQDSGCKIQISPDSGGMPDRSVTLTGAPDSIQAAKMLLSEIVDKGRPSPAFHHNDGQGNSVQEVMIPASKAGLVIGKGGETIKQLQERAGVKMVMIQEGPQNTGSDKPLRISGDPFKVQQAKDMVMDLIRDQGFREQRGEYGSRVSSGDSLDVPVPRFAVGIVIGRSGEMIKKIQNDTGVRIQFKPGKKDDLYALKKKKKNPSSFQVPVPRFAVGIVIGRSGEMIKKIQNDTGVRIQFKPGKIKWAVCSADKAAADANAAAWAAYYSQYQQQPQGPMTPTSAAPGTTQTNGQGQGQPQQDYTKAWEEYYKKQGQAAPQAAAATASQPGGQPDYSAAWAEYYRQQAAYYGQGAPQAMGAAPQAQQVHSR